MKDAEEIREIIVNQLGYKDLESYLKLSAAPRTGPLTQEEIDRLSPDTVDNKAFWHVCHSTFGLDPVCNLKAGPISTCVGANRQNLGFARVSGVLGWMDQTLLCNPNGTLIEIGPGYGNLHNYVEVTHPRVSYYGFDVQPLTNGIAQLQFDGTMHRDMIQDSVASVFYSSNVFQHLSARQRTTYFQDAASLLTQDGNLMFNLLCHKRKPDFVYEKGNYDEKGTPYLDHYGQLTPIPDPEELIAEVESNGFQLMQFQKRTIDSLYSFLFTRKRPVPPAPAVEEIKASVTEPVPA